MTNKIEFSTSHEIKTTAIKQKASNRGGARPGAGRKPKSLVIADTPLTDNVSVSVAVDEARHRIRDNYPHILDSLFVLMEGGKQVTRRWELAGLITVDAYSDPDSNGKQMKVKKQLFPDNKPDEMIQVWKQEVVYPPDSPTAQFLFNRLAGKPSEEKISPLDESQEGVTSIMPTREELLRDVLERLWCRYEERSIPSHIPQVVLSAAAQPAKAKPAKAKPKVDQAEINPTYEVSSSIENA